MLQNQPVANFGDPEQMTIELAERLKSELTDKYVVVADDVAELRRFRGLTGTVKTVNMNGRALVQFNGPEDISWYDIDPNFLRVVDAPLPRKAEASPAETKPAAPAAKGPAKASAGKSPLELARQQGAAGAKPATAGGGEKKLSPLELAQSTGSRWLNATSLPCPSQAGRWRKEALTPRIGTHQQGAAKAQASSSDAPSETAEAAAAPESSPEPPATPAEDTSGLSKLELARTTGAGQGQLNKSGLSKLTSAASVASAL